MHHAVELCFDRSTDDAIRRIWVGLAEAGLDATMRDIGARPHVTVAVHDTPALNTRAEEFESFFAEEPTLPITFSSVGSFHGEEGIVFLAPVVTQRLLDLHRRFHAQFADLRDTGRANYLPGSWVPHCTVAFKVPPQRLPEALGFARERLHPIEGWITHAALVAFEAGSPIPVRLQREVRLANRPAVPPSRS